MGDITERCGKVLGDTILDVIGTATCEGMKIPRQDNHRKGLFEDDMTAPLEARINAAQVYLDKHETVHLFRETNTHTGEYVGSLHGEHTEQLILWDGHKKLWSRLVPVDDTLDDVYIPPPPGEEEVRRTRTTVPRK